MTPQEPRSPCGLPSRVMAKTDDKELAVTMDKANEVNPVQNGQSLTEDG